MIAYVSCSVKSSCYIISCKGNSAYPAHVGVGRLIMIRWRSFTNLLVGTATHSRKQVTCKPGTYLVKNPANLIQFGDPTLYPPLPFRNQQHGYTVSTFPIWIWWHWILDPSPRESPWSPRHIPNKYSQSSLLKAGFLFMVFWSGCLGNPGSLSKKCSHFLIGKISEFHHYKKSSGKL